MANLFNEVGLIYGLGGVGEGKELDFSDRDYVRALDHALEAGIYFFDTAEAYSGGRSEQILGDWLTYQNRAVVKIATKVSPENLTAKASITCLKASLKRLNTDYVDLYQIHWPNPIFATQEVADTLFALKETGLVKNFGVCNYSVPQLQNLADLTYSLPLVSTQIEVSLLDTFQVERGVKCASELKMSTLAYSPLGKGRLNAESTLTNRLQAVAIRNGVTISQLALAWLRQLGDVIPIVATRNKDHLEENIASASFSIPDHELEAVSNIVNGQLTEIPGSKIKIALDGDGNRSVYTTIEEALENKLLFEPSPSVLAMEIFENPDIKPVKVQKRTSGFFLVEGRIRYWAWRIAFGPDKPIPCIIVEAQVD